MTKTNLIIHMISEFQNELRECGSMKRLTTWAVFNYTCRGKERKVQGIDVHSKSGIKISSVYHTNQT